MAKKSRRRSYPERKTALGRFIKTTYDHPEWPVILFEGDSWFSYPLNTNIVPHIRARGQMAILNDARIGDEIHKIAFHNQGKKFRKYLQRFDFDFIFLSGGGNDILAKGGIKRFLKDPLPGSGTIDDFFDKGKFALMLAEIKLAYEEIIRLRDQTETRPIIVVHGYDYPVVDNGVNLVVKKLGPWLFKYLRKKGAPEAVQREISVFLIDAFNQVLFDLAVENSRFVHVDTRGLLPDDGDWANEIHPTGAGFARVADRMLLEAGLS